MMPDPSSWMFAPSVFLASVLIGYFHGSIPFGLLLTRIAGKGDIRETGSGNIGATNVLRTAGPPWAVATLMCDILKATSAALIARRWGIDAACLAAFSAFVGHLFPVWLNFRGGKGVATYIGALLGVWSPGAFVFCLLWLLVALLFRYSSLAALVASAVTPLVLGLVAPWSAAGLAAGMTMLLVYRHSDNIERLSSGQEPTIGSKG